MNGFKLWFLVSEATALPTAPQLLPKDGLPTNVSPMPKARIPAMTNLKRCTIN